MNDSFTVFFIDDSSLLISKLPVISCSSLVLARRDHVIITVDKFLFFNAQIHILDSSMC